MSHTQTSAPALDVRPDLGRRLVAEFVGTALLVTVVVGSGIAAQRLSPDNVGLQLLENSTATAFGLTVLILLFGPISGAHFNPVVSAADWLLGRRDNAGITGGHVAAYTGVQVLGAIAGAELANLMYRVPVGDLSGKTRTGADLLLGEVVATAGLIALIFALARTGRGVWAAPAVGAYIGAAYWFTSSTSFANPAVTIGRMFSDTFAGISPGSVPGFITAQVVGAAVGVALVAYLYGHIGTSADVVVIPHPAETHAPSQTEAQTNTKTDTQPKTGTTPPETREASTR
ncbi:MAG TPA: MIP/aquaporin family protein [Microlunatus sp.]|nr:MIP/aquaporin family protein [Microlunatus sp.]